MCGAQAYKEARHTYTSNEREKYKNIMSEVCNREFNRAISNINNKETIMAKIFQVPHAS